MTVELNLKENGELEAVFPHVDLRQFTEFLYRVAPQISSRRYVGCTSEAATRTAYLCLRPSKWCSIREGHFSFLHEWRAWERQDGDEHVTESGFKTGTMRHELWLKLGRPFVTFESR